MDLLTVKQVAERLQVTERTVYSYITDGKLKAKKIGGGRLWRIEESELQAFIERCQ